MLKIRNPSWMTPLLVLIFSGCSTVPAPPPQTLVKEVPGPTRIVDNSCLYFKAITPTDDDVRTMSRSLVDQISNHDKVGIQHCGWKLGASSEN